MEESDTSLKNFLLSNVNQLQIEELKKIDKQVTALEDISQLIINNQISINIGELIGNYFIQLAIKVKAEDNVDSASKISEEIIQTEDKKSKNNDQANKGEKQEKKAKKKNKIGKKANEESAKS